MVDPAGMRYGMHAVLYVSANAAEDLWCVL